MKIEVNVEKKYVFLILTGILVLAGSIFVYAYGSGGPASSFGHTSDELNIISDLILPFKGASKSYALMFRDSSSVTHKLEWEQDSSPQFRLSDGLEVHGSLCLSEGGAEDGSDDATRCINEWADLTGSQGSSCTLLATQTGVGTQVMDVPSECRNGFCKLMLTVTRSGEGKMATFDYTQRIANGNFPGETSGIENWVIDGFMYSTSGVGTFTDIRAAGRNGGSNGDIYSTAIPGTASSARLQHDSPGEQTQTQWSINLEGSGSMRLYIC